MNICSYILYTYNLISQDMCYDVLMNVIDYIKWRGDLSFSKDHFNYVDGLIFSLLAYNSCDIGGNFKIKDIINTSFTNQYDQDLLLEQLRISNRYKNLIFHDYVSILHSETNEQFAAMMIDISNKETVICFRGTDSTITGWNEDFELSYKEVPAQIDALNYLSTRTNPFRKYIVVGHSKGGNLALYSATNCNRLIQNRIREVISYDGPGLKKNTYSIDSFNRIKNRYIKIVPQLDVVGLIFDMEEKKIVVSSDAKGFGQHSGFTWHILSNQFEVTNLNDRSLLLKNAIDNFLNKTTEEERKQFTNDLFNALKNYKIKYVEEINVKIITSILSDIVDMSDDTKITINIMIKELLDVFTNTVFDDMNEKVKNIVYNIKPKKKRD